MSLLYFGTDGIRGPYGEPPLETPFLRRLGYALARYFEGRRPSRKLVVAAGRDPRLSGPALLRAVAEGFAERGHRVFDAGVVPTPALATAVVAWRADLGLMFTASHNPPGDNGLKLFDEHGLKFDPAVEAEIEAGLAREPPPPDPSADFSLKTLDALELYRRARAALLPANALADWIVSLDTAHGATCETTPEVFRRLGATVHVQAGEADGARINVGVGSEHPAALAALVRATAARVGFAHDGDGDRLVVCDETGAIVDGDQVLGLLALHELRRGRLKHGLLVTTIQSNLGLDRTLEAAGGRVERVAVGDRNVLLRLLERGASFGGENSGHLIFPEISPCGDGLLAALMVARVLLETGQSLSALRAEVTLLPQVTANLRVREKLPLENLPTFAPALRAAEETLRDRGRVLARYSGTEKKLRLLVEGPNLTEAGQWLAQLKTAASQDLGVP